jgi:hypothetical protein
MNSLEAFRYYKDDPKEFSFELIPKKQDEIQYKKYLSNLLTNSIKVSEDIFPSITKGIEQVFGQLKIENNFNFYVTSDHTQANAACSVMPFSTNPDIVLTSRLVELLSKDELKFVIGHEIAHYHYQHSLYPNHTTASGRIETLNMLNLSRGAEISADRIGFIACASLENSLKAIIKIASGLSEKHINFNFSAYLKQLKELETIGKSDNELWSTHPNFLVRARALIWFASTTEYKKFCSTKGGAYSLKEIDEKINDTINRITGNEIEISNKEVYERALIWGTLKIFVKNGKLSKDEQDKLKNKFGEKKINSAISFLKSTNEKSFEKRIEEAFEEAKLLLKSEKNRLMDELKDRAENIGKNNAGILKILSKFANILEDTRIITL